MQQQIKQTQVGWGFWLLWVLATTVGLLVGTPGGLLVGIPIGGAVVGAVVGASQWLVLRGKVSQAGWWVLATTVSFTVSWFLNAGPSGGSSLDEGWVVGGWCATWGLGWGLVGVSQWLVLRGEISKSGWWVLTSIVAFSLGSWPVAGLGFIVIFTLNFLSGGALTLILGETLWVVLTGAWVGAWVGAFVGVITGGALVWLLRQPRREAQIVVGRPPNDD